MDRDILHIHVPAFFVAVARAADPSLRGRPVAVAPPASRGVVLAASPEARLEGVRKGMPVPQARRICPGLRLVPPHPERAEQAQGVLTELARRFTPLWEPWRPGHLYLDLTGGARLFGSPRDVAGRLERELSGRLGLLGSVGVAGNKLVSRVASQFLEAGGVCDVLRGSEAAFLAPLPLDLLPGVGTHRRRVLEGWNVCRVGQIPAIPPSHLEAVFGAFGQVLRGRARGEDWEPVHPPKGEPCVFEGEVLERDEIDDGLLLARLRRLVEIACTKLRAERRAAGRLEVSLGYSDGATARRALRLVPPTAWDHEVFPRARHLFFAASRRRVRIRRLGVALSRFSAGTLQLDLFQASRGDLRREALCRALDQIRCRSGFEAIGWGAPAPRSPCP